MTKRRHGVDRPFTGSSASDEKIFGYRFADPGLLRWALTHRSLSHETSPSANPDPKTDNEQLEFVGDAVLGLVVAEALFRQFPDSREGELTRLRASVVSRRSLAEVAARLRLGDHLRLGRGEAGSGGRSKPALLANALEAVIAAIYLDGGMEAARRLIEAEILRPALPSMRAALAGDGTFSGAIGDHKTALQERLQSTGTGSPHYVLTAESGPDHQRTFRVAVELRASDGSTQPLAESEGRTKKEAQQAAARLALERLAAAAASPVEGVELG